MGSTSDGPLKMKYYVSSGPLKVIINSNSPREAALVSLRNFAKGKLLDTYLYVSEKGFNKDIIFSTIFLLNEIRNEAE